MNYRHLYIIVLLASLCSIARGQTSLYWFDDDFEHAATSGVKNGTIRIDASSLTPGIHTLHYLYQTASGVQSSTHSKSFLVATPQAKGVKGEYWFDHDYDSKTASSTKEGIININASELSPGIHTLYYHQLDIGGVASSAYAHTFLVATPQTKGVKGEYWFDHDYNGRTTTSIIKGIIYVNVSTLSPGIHTLYYHQLDDTGLSSSTYAHTFIVPMPQAVATKGEYWFDNNFAERKPLPLSSNAVGIDISELYAGLHSVHYHALSNDGVASATYTKLFWIMNQPTTLCAYHYWVNDHVDNILDVYLNGFVSLYPLNIDVPELPLRTTCFHFEMTDGKPMVYAKNTLNLVLEATDGSGQRIVSDYVDYRVSEAVNATLLLPEEPQTFSKPEGLKWFKVEAGKGDILTFKASTACTLQLFSPTGGELWAVSGNDAKMMGGTKADDKGTFYLAVHDVTDTEATEVTVSYLWEAAPKPSGDVNGDNAVDVADIATIISVMAGETGYATEQVDVNGDGVVDVADIATVISIMAEMARMQQLLEDEGQ